MNNYKPGLIRMDIVPPEVYKRPVLVEIHIADIHFGAYNPKEQYDTLKAQFIDKIYNMRFDILCIDGDLFECKTMSNSDNVLYASLFIEDLVNICRGNGATLVLIHGTKYHDANQLRLFYHYLDDPGIDLRIIENTRFEYIKGGKFLCIPEEYGKGEDYYLNFLFGQGPYDGVFMHGNINGAIYTGEDGELGSDKAPTFNVSDFSFSRGPIIAGHVHVAGCYEKYAYYCGSPYRWKFGEEQPKGFYIILRDLDNGTHYTHFEEIYSRKYITISIDDLLSSNPKDAIEYITNLKETQNIDYIRLTYSDQDNDISATNLNIIKNYYRGKNNYKLFYKEDKKKKLLQSSEKSIDNEKDNKYQYMFDPNLSEYDILCRYINDNKGYQYITVDKLLDILKDI